MKRSLRSTLSLMTLAAVLWMLAACQSGRQPAVPATPIPTLAPMGDIQTIPQGLVYLGDPETLALGFNMSAGGSIGSLLYRGRELVDRSDYGRYIQLSFYDGEDTYGMQGSDPYGNWGWNPIQAGSKGGSGAKVLEYRSGAGMVYIKALGKEWGLYDQDSDMIFETWAWQRDGYFEIHTRATHTGADAHGLATQELPATYFATSLTHMYSYLGGAPFTGGAVSELKHVARPGEIAGQGRCPQVSATENWAAFGDADRNGLILAAPPQPFLEPRWNICLLFAQPPVGYISPMALFDVPPQAVYESTYYLIPGPIEMARSMVYDLIPHTTWTFDLNSFEGWQGASTGAVVKNGILSASLSPGQFLQSTPGLRIPRAIASNVTLRARSSQANARLCLSFITLDDPAWDKAKSLCQALPPGDFTALTFDWQGNASWSEGVVTQMRLSASARTPVEIDSIAVTLNGYAWEFASAGDAEGWAVWNHLAPLQVSQGLLNTQATDDDPYMASPALNLDAETIPVVKIRMSVTAGHVVQVFFITALDAVYDEAKSLRAPLIADGQFHEYTLDMSKVAGWKGAISQIRLDPTESKAAIMVDYVRIVSQK